jgi:hypothetical protein
VFKGISDGAQNVVNSINTLIFQNPAHMRRLLTEETSSTDDMDLAEGIVQDHHSSSGLKISGVKILSSTAPVHHATHKAASGGSIDTYTYLRHASPAPGGNAEEALARFKKMRKSDKVLKKLEKQDEADTEVGQVEAEIAKYLQHHSVEEKIEANTDAQRSADFSSKHLKEERKAPFTLIDREKISTSLHNLQRQLARRWSKLMQRVTKFDAYQVGLCKLLKKVNVVRNRVNLHRRL